MCGACGGGLLLRFHMFGSAKLGKVQFMPPSYCGSLTHCIGGMCRSAAEVCCSLECWLLVAVQQTALHAKLQFGQQALCG